MELSERYIKTLEESGYVHISEEQHGASIAWSGTTSEAAKIIMVTDGSLTLSVVGVQHYITSGGQFIIPPRTVYEAIASLDGVIFITGELFK